MPPKHLIDKLVESALKKKIFSGASLCVIKKDKILWNKIYGYAQTFPIKRTLTTSTLFDIASLTKPICTATLTMLAYQKKECSIEDPVKKYFSQIKTQNIQIKHLLNHTSGLPAWKPYHQELLKKAPLWIGDEKGQMYILDKIFKVRPVAPVESKVIYSDLGYILLGALLEKIFQKNLDEAFYEHIAQPLKMESTFFNPLLRHRQMVNPVKEDFVATENCPWRKIVLCGEVMDGTAYCMGGIAGHAGLFSTAEDLTLWMRELQKARRGEGRLIQKDTFDTFCQIPPQRDLTLPFFTLGFDTPVINSTAGQYFSPHSIGHLAFTGCSFWWDLEKDLSVILLTNRVHPTRRKKKQIRLFRPQIHDVIMESLELI